MHFHITYEFDSSQRNSAQDRFRETGALPPDGIEMLGRWHAAGGNKGFMLAETDDVVAIGHWVQQWTDLLSFEVTPVMNDEQVSEVLS